MALLLAIALSALASATGWSQPAAAKERSFTFAETGKKIRGPILDYWVSNGDAQTGVAISDELPQRSETDGKLYTVQSFARAVLICTPAASNRAT
jgi:hypothetical protein